MSQKEGKTSHAMGGGAPQKKVAINALKMEIVDFSVIPSTMTLARLEAITVDEA